MKGSDPLLVERKIRNEIEMGLDGVNQIRIAGSMYAHTKLYNSNIVFVSSKEEVEKLVNMFKKMKGENFVGLLALPLKNISEDKVIDLFWKSTYPTMLGLVVEKGSNAQQKQVTVEVRHSLKDFISNMHHFFPSASPTWKKEKKAKSNSTPMYMLANVESEDSAESKSRKIRIDIPGGKRMLGESPIDCALREGQEETGINFAEYRSKLREVTYGRTPAQTMAYFVYDNVNTKKHSKFSRNKSIKHKANARKGTKDKFGAERPQRRRSFERKAALSTEGNTSRTTKKILNKEGTP